MDGGEEASTTTAGGKNGCVVATPVLRHPFMRPGIGIVRRRPCFDAMSASYLVELGESSGHCTFIRRGGEQIVVTQNTLESKSKH
jgi:hypothetical protein